MKQPKPLSITELNKRVRELLESRVPTLWVIAEISNLSQRGASGHLYFKLKDAQAQVDAVLWQSTREKLAIKLKDGMEVLVQARVTLYEVGGRYQLEVLQLEERGLGRLQRRFLKLKDKLGREGLFSDKRKRPLPAFPRHVALITSTTGAAVRDMLKSIQDRCPKVAIDIFGVLVQGQQAYGQIAEAIERLNVYRPQLDLLILGRGGGSIEDLWAFNEEVLARAIARSRIPIVTAIGHEVDQTIADLVADRFVPTPTAVGLVFPDQAEVIRKLGSTRERLANTILGRLRSLRDRLDRLSKTAALSDAYSPIKRRQQRLDELLERMRRCLHRTLKSRRELLDALARRRVLQDPLAPLSIRREQLASIEQRMATAGNNVIERHRSRIQTHAAQLHALSPLKVLGRGYSVTLKDGQELRNWQEISDGDLIETRLAAGYLESKVIRRWMK